MVKMMDVKLCNKNRIALKNVLCGTLVSSVTGSKCLPLIMTRSIKLEVLFNFYHGMS